MEKTLESDYREDQMDGVLGYVSRFDATKHIRQDVQFWAYFDAGNREKSNTRVSNRESRTWVWSEADDQNDRFY